MRVKRFTFVVAAVLAGLTLMGVAYAAWTQDIQLTGSVATGTFDIIWTDVSLDRSTEPQYQGNWVANVSYEVSSDGHTITYVVSNAYPGWESRLNCRVKNNGTVPAKLSVVLNTSGSISVSGHEALPAQLGAGATSDNVVLTMSVPSSVTEQGATYTFTLTVTGTQFNINP